MLQVQGIRFEECSTAQVAEIHLVFAPRAICHRIRWALHEHVPQKEGGWEVPQENSSQDTLPPPTRRHSVPSS